MTESTRFTAAEVESENDTVTTEPFKIDKVKQLFLMANIAGATLNGTIKLEISNTGEAGEWADVPNSQEALPGSGGNLFWEVTTGARLIRASITTADTNTATVNLTGHGKD